MPPNGGYVTKTLCDELSKSPLFWGNSAPGHLLNTGGQTCGGKRERAVSGSGPDTTLTLRWRAVSHVGGKESYTPPLPQTPYELVVNPRNIF